VRERCLDHEWAIVGTDGAARGQSWRRGGRVGGWTAREQSEGVRRMNAWSYAPPIT
jgi:hypothetical protein